MGLVVGSVVDITERVGSRVGAEVQLETTSIAARSTARGRWDLIIRLILLKRKMARKVYIWYIPKILWKSYLSRTTLSSQFLSRYLHIQALPNTIKLNG
jgi:hypothetical protein